MLEVKGAGIKYFPKYVKDNLGEEGYQKWFASLTPEAQKIFGSPILASNWYPARFAAFEPEEKILANFFDNDKNKSKIIARYAADDTLGGIYRTFVRLGSPSFIISKASSILTTFFKPSSCETVLKEKTHVIIRITLFPEMTEIMEIHIGAWVERALEICGCKNVEVKINQSLAKGGPYYEFEASWS